MEFHPVVPAFPCTLHLQLRSTTLLILVRADREHVANVDRRHQYAACAASEGCSLPLNLARITARIRIRFPLVSF
jgi:hypothetical protein